MAIDIRSRVDTIGRPRGFFDSLTDETIARFQAVNLDYDFTGPGHAVPTSATVGYDWVAKLVKTAGSPTVAPVVNQPGGVLGIAIDATSEKQEATLYANDVLNWDVTKGLTWEARLAMHVLPSAAQVEMVWGLQSAWIDGPDNAGIYVEFQALANGSVNLRIKDGTNTYSYPSGVVLVADAFHSFRIDASDVTRLDFFIDGVRVSNGLATGFLASGASAVLQPYCSVYKASGAGVGTLYLDAIQAGMNRS
jgi:hypothetical protein